MRGRPGWLDSAWRIGLLVISKPPLGRPFGLAPSWPCPHWAALWALSPLGLARESTRGDWAVRLGDWFGGVAPRRSPSRARLGGLLRRIGRGGGHRFRDCSCNHRNGRGLRISRQCGQRPAGIRGFPGSAAAGGFEAGRAYDSNDRRRTGRGSDDRAGTPRPGGEATTGRGSDDRAAKR